MTTTRSHAIVIGASMAGLAAARVLADSFTAVTVLDRDDLPSDAQPRKGVPQGRHAHGLLAAGEQALEAFFPGIKAELVANGATSLRAIEDTRWFQLGGYRTRQTNGELPATFFSRPFLEAAVRDRVAALPNVTIRPGVRVAGLHGDAVRVRGVDLVDGERLDADFVVDCSGRTSSVGRWLEALGYGAPPTSEVHIDMGYASRLLHRRATDPIRDEYVICASASPEFARGGVLFPVDGDRWVVTLFGFHGDHPPTDDAGFLAFAESLPAADVASVLRVAEPATPTVSHRLASDQRRHFEKVRTAPGGFVTLGDSICSFNPIYGQGMSSALQQAQALQKVLREAADIGSSACARAFYKRAKKIVDVPWQIAAGADFVLPQTTGTKPPGTDFVNRYLAKAFVAAQHDPVVNDAMMRVQNLLASPPSMMKPAMVRRVLRGAKRGPAPTLEPRPEPAAPSPLATR